MTTRSTTETLHPWVCEDELFCIRADKSEVVMEPKNHYTTEDEAKGAVEGFVRRWEFEAALHARSGEFRFCMRESISSTAARLLHRRAL